MQFILDVPKEDVFEGGQRVVRVSDSWCCDEMEHEISQSLIGLNRLVEPEYSLPSLNFSAGRSTKMNFCPACGEAVEVRPI